MRARAVGMALLAGLSVALGACFGVQIRHYSAPQLADGTAPVHEPGFSWGDAMINSIVTDRTFALTDLSFSLVPDNERNRSVLVLPLPHVGADENFSALDFYVPGDDDSLFHVGLTIRPHRGGFVLDPEKILLTLPDSRIIAPTRVLGPVEVPAAPSARNLNDGFGIAAKVGWRNLPIDLQSLSVGTEIRVYLQFPVPPPDPMTPFSIQIDGLQLDGSSYAIPPVKFSPRQVRQPRMTIPWLPL